jgi:VWFA-related protein
VAIAIALLAVATATPFSQQQQPEPQRAQGTLKEDVTSVLVDVVVRDRRGQPVRDLVPTDFRVFEDGVPQPIDSLTPMFENAPAPAMPAVPAAGGSTIGGAAATAAPNSGPGITALVFHGLDAESRRRSIDAARSYLGSKEEMAHYLGVFGIDLSLKPLVPFTRNGVAVRRALDAIASGSAAGFNTEAFRDQKASADQQATMAGAAVAAAEAAGGPGTSAAMGTAAGAAQLAQMQANIVESFARMEHDQQGYIVVDALSAIVSTMGRLPGRKSLVLFSQGIAVPAAVHRLFLGVIDAANRANVSIYTVDAAGLRAESDQAMIRDRVNSAASVGINTGYAIDGPGGAFTQELEAAEHDLRSDPATALGQLARDTGGLLFTSSNNLRLAFDRVESDLRNYYLLGYTPRNTTYDGRFRTIQVRVRRPDVTVAARRGYFAVRNSGGAPMNAWEAVALGALEAKPVPNMFPVRAAALMFPERGRPGLVPVVVELGTAPLSFVPAPDGKSYTSDFTVLARFVGPDNQVVRKMSQHYEITGPIAEIDRAKQGEVIFYRESELGPGLYTLETVVHDALSGKSSVRFSSVEVPKYGENTLRISSLVLVRRGEKVEAKERRADNPLLVNDLLLSPNLGDPVSKAAREVGFYFAVYPGPGGPATESLIELHSNGKPLAQVPMPAAAPDGSGRIQQVGRLPLDQLAPGTYELRAVARQGGAQVFRSTMLRITD